ncbi:MULTISPECIES: HPr family phosphocarrier protein [Bifidobacterium]|uniref:HPr family phosphocarrier protein n=1 Tax=Bifidobacterium TaxID=1678 RepID=UPI00226B740E|nr:MULTISPECIES: HPr family phosphocarrier protein [unclassified Bifidobacterium]MCX8647952.1 HPr family phosphocarrier protein [Bifidobacterium sp. B4107]MCX8652132.1 HPr family phosphocarrier protein [Bifidobacterium sp. B4111]MCX8658232.1 HPr family phosphocarrier protein [Bifidobacterium sp. B4114]MCX8688115.1 HPr family phosphocarrier protein [Bifidobacterium sp. B4142]
MATEFTFTISDPEGMHARPAGRLVEEAQKYRSSIILDDNGTTADAKRIFAVMALGAKQGDVIDVTVDGPDQDKAAEELQAFFKENL